MTHRLAGWIAAFVDASSVDQFGVLQSLSLLNVEALDHVGGSGRLT